MSRACCVALPRGAMGLSAVCDCGISCPFITTIFLYYAKSQLGLNIKTTLNVIAFVPTRLLINERLL